MKLMASPQTRERRIMPWWSSGGQSFDTTNHGSNTGAHNLHTREYFQWLYLEAKIQLTSKSWLVYKSHISRTGVSCGFFISCITGTLARLTKKEMDCPLAICTSPRMSAPVSQSEMIEDFWRKRKKEIEAIEDFGERAIPMTRLKKVICAEKSKMMMTFDTPSFLTKACEIFVQELTFRAWMCASSQNRSIILDFDIAEAIATTESYDFLKDILHGFGVEHNSIPRSKPTKKRSRSTNQPSTSRHSPLNQVPRLHPQFAQYPPGVRIPLSLPPTNVQPMPLPFPFPLSFQLQTAPPLMSTTVTPTPVVTPTMMALVNYMPTGLGFFGNGISTSIPSNFFVSNNIVALGAMTYPLQVGVGAIANIPSTAFYMNMTNASAPAYDIGGATNTNMAAAPGQSVAIDELDHHILLEVEETASMMHACDTINANDNIDGQQEQQIDLDDDQQEQQIDLDDGQPEKQDHGEEAIFNHPLDALDGTLDAVAASTGASNAGGDNFDVNWDVFEILDDSLMSNFWEYIMEVDDGQQEQQIDLDDGQQEQQDQGEEAIFDHPLDTLDGTLDAIAASAGASNAGGDNFDVNWDVFEIPDDSLMSNFWEYIMEVNPPLPDATTSTDLLPHTSDMQDLEGFHHESYLFDDLSPTQAQAAGSPKAPV